MIKLIIFDMDGVLVDLWDDKDKPLLGRFYSAHFAFTVGQFCKEVTHDPNYYFHGEEISIAARAYTHGYDIYHPHKVVCWHEYTRKGRSKQWDDDPVWGNRNNECHLRNRKLFEMDGEKRAIQKSVTERKAPPDAMQFSTDQEFDDALLRIFKHCIDIGYDRVKETDYDFSVVAFHDEGDL